MLEPSSTEAVLCISCAWVHDSLDTWSLLISACSGARSLPPLGVLAGKLLQIVVSRHHLALLIGHEQAALALQGRLPAGLLGGPGRPGHTPKQINMLQAAVLANLKKSLHAPQHGKQAMLLTNAEPI